VKIDKYLTQGEAVIKAFTLKSHEIHATNKRLFVSTQNGHMVADFDYKHISSIVFILKKYYWLIGFGIALAVASWFLFSNIYSVPSWNDAIKWILIAIGIGCIVLGVFLKKEVMTLFVIGYGKVPLEGERFDLDGLFVTIREKIQVITSVTKASQD
jgi:hypothetical protein